jgi:DNA-binding MarR family transcriptional regulator
LDNDNLIETARYICDTGKLVHDRITKIQSLHLASIDGGTAGELSVAQLHAVKTLFESGELTMNELAEQLSVSPPSASAMVDRLVEKGVVCREHSTQDRRKVVVRISPEAVMMAKEIKLSILQFFIGLVDKIGLETARQWCDVLACVKTALSEEADG